MKIQVIGSGNMWGEYNSASYLIDDSILIDIPNGTCKALHHQGISYENIKDVLITHFHGDHYFDIPFFILFKKKLNIIDLNIYCAKNGERKIRRLYKLAFPHSYKRIFKSMNISFLSNDIFLVNGKYNVERVSVDHGSFKPAYGYIISMDNIKIGFTGDTTLCEGLEYMLQKCDYVFGDCSLINGTSKHMGADFLEMVTKKYPNCKYIASHMDDETRKYLKKVKIKNVIIPQDGEIFKF